MLHTKIVLLILLCFTFACTTRGEREKQPPSISIKNAVETTFALDGGIPEYKIDISENNGILTLSGTVSTIMAKERAEEISQSTKGVTSIINNIKINPPSVKDSIIKRDLNRLLINDPAADSFDIKVKVNNGKVTLKGEVNSKAERDIIATLSKGIRGVKEVTNDLKINYKEDRTHFAIKKDIQRIISLDPILNLFQFNVEVKDGTAKISGKVSSAYQKARLEKHAWINGVKQLNLENVKVLPWDELPRERETIVSETIKDEEIAKIIKQAYNYAQRIDGKQLSIMVNSGIVSLYGKVDNYRMKAKAEEIAANTIGVLGIKNFIKIRYDKPTSDKQINELINKIFRSDAYLQQSLIDTKIVNGKV
ncbi:MAG: BON domain-containing protein, partial [bacterium]